MKHAFTLKYQDGNPIQAGDKVSVRYSNSYAGGGGFLFHFNGTVIEQDEAGGLVVEVDTWLNHHDTSQRFGSGKPHNKVTVSSSYDYKTSTYVLRGTVEHLPNA